MRLKKTLASVFLIIFCVSVTLSQEEILQSEPIKLKNKNVQSYNDNSSISSKQENLAALKSSNSGYSEGKSVAGGLSVSLSGAATYSIPFTLPPGINGSTPSIGLGYSSQSSGGNAGWGWNISGLSAINRTATTLFHDGYIDPVDLDQNDRFELDGQRLILKSGTYGANGSVYETENHSNIKVIAHGGSNNSPSYFIVYNPDGSRFWYGNTTDSKNESGWRITKRQDNQGNTVHYKYSGIDPLISLIQYGAQGNETAPNEIKFFYTRKERAELSFVGGEKMVASHILKRVEIKSGGVLYRKYELAYNKTSLDYELLKSVTEKNSLGTALPPVYFLYDDTPNGLERINQSTDIIPGISSRHHNMVIGDFNGDGSTDFITYDKDRENGSDKINLFDRVFDPYGQNTVLGRSITAGDFIDIFSRTHLYHNDKVASAQGFAIIKETSSKQISFKTIAMAAYGPVLQDEKIWQAPTYIASSSLSETLNITANVNGGSSNQTAHKVNATNIIYNSANAVYTAKDYVSLKPGFHARTGVSFNGTVNRSGSTTVPMKFLSGDFNGDGLTDVISITEPYSYGRKCTYVPILGREVCEQNFQQNFSDVYYINLDRRVGSNFSNKAGRLRVAIGPDSVLRTGDFDGDGVTDIYHFKQGKLYVYTLNKNKQLSLLKEITNSNINIAFPILLGDYNGDGKTDYAFPKEENSSVWRFFLGNGSGVAERIKDIGVIYNRYSETARYAFKGKYYPPISPNERAVFEYNYIPTDFNNDGKTDIVYHKTITPFSSNTHSHQAVGLVANFADGFGSVSFKFTNYIESDNDGVKKFGIPIFAELDKTIKGNEYGFISGNTIQSYTISKDHRTDVNMTAITSNGHITEIDYARLENRNDGIGSIQTYTKGYDQKYPYLDLASGSSIKLVKEVRQSAGGIDRTKRFSYNGAVVHLQGLGFIGFQKVSKSNWEGTDIGTLWTTTVHDPQKRNAMINQWVISSSYPLTSEPSSFVSKMSYDYDTALNSRKVFSNYPNRITTVDGLKNFTTTENLTYDSYKNISSRYKTYPGGSELTEFTYSNDIASVNENYHAGRPTKKIQTKTLGGDTFSTEERYSYVSNLVSEIKKQGNGTSWLTEGFTYNKYGSIIKRTLSGEGVSTRIEEFTYDAGRFMTEKIAMDKLKTTYVYDNNTGQLMSRTNSYDQKTEFKYDAWNRLIKETDYLGNTIDIAYQGSSDGSLTRTVTNSLGGGEQAHVNRWGWETQTKIRNVNNEWVSTSYLYDALGRKKGESEPKIGGAPTLWTRHYFDQYGRPKSRTLPTGRAMNFSYNDLTTTVNDGVKTAISTRDAVGNIIKLQDPGGTINYTYYANGSMKSADYGGHVINIEIDGWGRKVRMDDPSAGVSTYSYNIFGELLEETNPKGVTTMTYDAYGKNLTREVKGDQTDFKLIYDYDTVTQLVKSITSTDQVNNKAFSFEYDYDTTPKNENRVISIKETATDASYEKAFSYDPKGRINTETYKARSLFSGAENTVKIRNHYHSQSGGLNKISDFTEGTVLWEIKKVSDYGQLTEVNLGNGIVKQNQYDQYGLPVKFEDKESGTNGITALDLDLSFDAQRGNLTSRYNKAFRGEEGFTYDSQDRLTQTTGAITHTQSYDPKGRIKENSDVGKYLYQGGSGYKLKEIELNQTGDAYYEQHALQQVTYNSFKKPVDIYEEGKGRVSFEYGPMLNRSAAYYGGLDEDKTKRRYKKTYSSIIPVEIIHDSNDNSSKFVTYIGGDAYSAPVVHVKKDGGSPINEYHYLHRDHLGSILAITDSNANIIEETHFGAWGKIEQFSASSGLTEFGYDSLLGRGYTGHEHFTSVGLIHMNGRMYDANLGRFLSPDNYIQDPFNTQSFNRYGYVWNNPLRYNDPTGEIVWVAVIIGAIVGAYVGGTIANGGELNPAQWDWSSGRTWGGIIVGAILGAIAGESIGSLITGTKAFGIFATKVSVLTPLGTVGLVSNEARGLDFTWTTVAGGSGTIEDVIRLPEEEAGIEDSEVFRAEVYVEGDYDDWVIGSEDVVEEEDVDTVNSILAQTVSRSATVGRLYGGARFTGDRRLQRAGRFRHSNGRIYSNRYYGGRWHSTSSIQLSKTRFNSTLRFASRVGQGLTAISVGATIYDGATNGWQNSHTADLVVTGVLYAVAVSNPLGWVVGGVYLIADLTTQYYTGKTITQNLFND